MATTSSTRQPIAPVPGVPTRRSRRLLSPRRAVPLALILSAGLALHADDAQADRPARGYTIPLLDLADQKQRQVVIDREPGQYLGHPTTVLLEDGKTMLAVYPKGHGRGAIVLKRSGDGGRTWSDRQPTPKSWETSKEVPTIHRVVGPDGKKRLILFSGLYPIRLAVSEDDGATWGELRPVGDFGGIVAMASVERLTNGEYLALFHDDGRFFRAGGKAQKPPVFTVYKTVSRDGGLTWGPPEAIATHPQAHLCEPGLVRSPDGKQLAVLLRENSRKFNSFVIVSDDEGRTWSQPRELPGALTGDRHVGRYAPDGRLVLTFRDTTHESPTKGDWVAWVGRYEDVVRGREGQYRVRLMKNHKGADCAYAGLELLPDGTFVATTYGHWVPGEPPFVVSVRFTLPELDALAGRAAGPGPLIERVQLDTVRSGFTKTHCWVHPRAGVIPGRKPAVVLTMQELLLSGSDVFGPLHEMRTDDLGKTWAGPVGHAATLGRRQERGGVEVGVCDFTPAWHARTGKLLGVGQTVRYKGDRIVPDPRRRETAYAVYDAASRTWSAWDVVRMPDMDGKFFHAGAGSAQRHDRPDGDLLIPIYFSDGKTPIRTVTVMRCRFDGAKLEYVEHGSEHTIPTHRGCLEPSLTKFGDGYFLTIRHGDGHGYVATSRDGLHFSRPQPWRWDDGTTLETGDTQQHWVTHSDGLFLAFTYKRPDNGHVFRHRAPLFLAEVDPEALTLRRATLRVLVPERGARLGNFAVVDVTPQETWVTVAEWMQPVGCEKYGSDNSVYAARIRWARPNRLVAE